MRSGVILSLATTIVAGAGCRSAPVGPYSTPSEGARQTSVAEALNREAADLIATDPAHAESLLRDALTRDLYFGPAHNNLGVVYLQQSKLYEAANEFEWARKLMPGHPDPRVNLALVLERVGKQDEALAAYGAALDVYPGHLPAIQGIASLTVRTGRDDERLGGWLDAIALQSGEPAWAGWARQQQLLRR